MSNPGESPEVRIELQRLAAESVEGPLAPDQQERLAALLSDNPTLRGEYLDYLLLDSLLQWEQPVAGVAEPRPAAAPSRGSRRWYAVAAIAATAAAILVGVVFWPRPKSGSPRDDLAEQQSVEPTDNTVALLVHTSGAVWGDSSVPTQPGSPLPPGRLRLESGVARLEFYCGASVIIEGPADFSLLSRTRASCAEGRLRATIPAHAQGFTIETPNIDLVDRGTEFGLRVGAGDPTEIHVFKGKVELYGAGAAGKEPLRQSLTGGQGVRIAAGGAADPIPTDSSAFITPQKLDTRIAAETARRRDEWAATLEQWRRDPALRAHYSFQDAPSTSRTLVDRAGRFAGSDGAIVGAAWASGRWPGRQALEFRRVSDRVRLDIPGEFESLTLATWVRFDGLPNKNNSLLMADGWEPGEIHWQVGGDGTAILGVQSSPKSRGAHYHGYAAVTPGRFGHWMHLAVVYDGAGRVVRHYVDGRPISEQPTEFNIPLRIDEAEIGNWNIAEHRNNTPIRFLNGALDDLMLFARPLDGEEIHRLYEQGRPPS
jgi:ferric-dicitrate binding protein FerR (iron transport regulator)